MFDLIITLSDLRATLRDIQGRTGQARLPLHLNRHRGGTEFLAHSGSLTEADGTLLPWSVDAAESTLPDDWTQSLRRERERPLVGLGIGVGAQEGKVMGLVKRESGQPLAPLDSIRIIGPQMPALRLTGAEERLFRPLWVTADGLYSRLVGTVGLRTFARLQHARVALIGAGGNGSLMAEQLATWMGCDGRLGIVDADRIELYNLPAWGATGGQDIPMLLGRPKAEALAERLRTFPDAPEIKAIVASVQDWSALAALKGYDLFVCCVDNPAARFAVTFLATLYLRPLLDIATGVFLGTVAEEHQTKSQQEIAEPGVNMELFRHNRLPLPLLEEGTRTMGADVRLTIPGSRERSGNCLLCLGGVGDLARVQSDLAALLSNSDVLSSGRFWEQRAGSLSLVNGDAVHQGMRMLIAFLEGSLSASTHWQMNQTLHSPPVWREVAHVQSKCPLCSLAGQADHALNTLDDLLARAIRHM